MCGIAGSPSFESGFDLYERNLDRGYYSSSVVAIMPDKSLFVKKVLGKLQPNEIPKFAKYYLFHSRGPTVETTEFKWSDNHPFTYGRYMVAHNGIIENFKEIGGDRFSVDSKVIPYLIDVAADTNQKVPIISTFFKLKGTFGCWVLDTDTCDVFIARHDITLFMYGAEFSSTNPTYMREVPPDVLFHINTAGAIPTDVGKFTASSKPKYFVPPK